MTLPFARRVRDVYIGAMVALSQAQQAPSASGSVSAEPRVAETVRRPDPGLARGVWEAPPSFFYILGGIVVAVAVVYALWRKGIVRFRRARSTSS